jgi:CBS domain-containing protein
VYGIGVTLLTGFGGGLWTTFIGWFLLQAGNAERRQSELQGALVGHVASELTAPTTPRVPADATVERAFTTMRETQTRVLPVYLGERFIGFVAIDDLAKLPPDQFPATYVTAIMTRLEATSTLAAGDDAREALAQMSRDGSQALAVVDAAGDLVGLITRESVLHWLSTRLSSPTSKAVQPADAA